MNLTDVNDDNYILWCLISPQKNPQKFRKDFRHILKICYPIYCIFFFIIEGVYSMFVLNACTGTCQAY